jgi:hypothetical protein
MPDNGPFQPGQPGFGQPADPNQGSQEPPQTPQQPGRRVIEQPFGPPIIIEEPVVPHTPLAQTIRANSQPPGTPPFTPPNQPGQSPHPQAPAPGYGAPYQAGPQPPQFQQNDQTQAPPQSYPPNRAPIYSPYQTAPVAPGNYPPGAYIGGSFPPGGYPPQGGPRRGGLPPWAPIAGGAVLVVVLIAIIIAATRGPRPSPTTLGTSTPKPTSTSQPTSTPAVSGTMELGSDWSKDSNGNITISGATSTFSASDALAWVAKLDQSAGALQAVIRCVQVSSDGTAAVIYTENYDIADASDTVLAEKYNSSFTDASGNPESAATVTKNGAAGTYRLEFVVNGVLRAEATFTYNG